MSGQLLPNFIFYLHGSELYEHIIIKVFSSKGVPRYMSFFFK